MATWLPALVLSLLDLREAAEWDSDFWQSLMQP